jgi:hypothetical protein
MQKIGATPKSPNRYQQLSIIAFAICVSIRYGIFDYPAQRYVNYSLIWQTKGGVILIDENGRRFMLTPINENELTELSL